VKPLTENQFRRLLILGRGGILVSGGTKRDWKPLYDRGLVEGELVGNGRYLNGIRITPDGLRALAEGLERYGWRDAG
jgi:hypothetical protein